MVLILIEIWQFWLKENVRFWHKATFVMNPDSLSEAGAGPLNAALAAGSVR